MVLTFAIFRHAKNHCKRLLKLSQTSFSGMVGCTSFLDPHLEVEVKQVCLFRNTSPIIGNREDWSSENTYTFQKYIEQNSKESGEGREIRQ